MRIFLLLSVLFLECGWVIAGDLDKAVMQISACSTTAAKSEASAKINKGYIERVDLSFSVSTSVPWVNMIVSNASTKSSVSLLDSVQKATNFSYSPRVQYQNVATSDLGTNGLPGRICAFDQTLYLIASNATAGATDQKITATVIYERP